MGLGATRWRLKMAFWTRPLIYNRIVSHKCNERGESDLDGSEDRLWLSPVVPRLTRHEQSPGPVHGADA